MKTFKVYLEEEIERRADQKAVIATDPHSGKKIKQLSE